MHPPDHGFFAILGHPVSHSLSPFLHGKAFALLDLPYRYTAIDVSAEGLSAKIADIVKEGCLGFNVTLPHKEAVIPLLAELDPTAKSIGAVNTVVVRERRLVGFNTDVDGVIQSLAPHAARIERNDCLMLGAGGAARSAA